VNAKAIVSRRFARREITTVTQNQVLNLLLEVPPGLDARTFLQREAMSSDQKRSDLAVASIAALRYRSLAPWMREQLREAISDGRDLTELCFGLGQFDDPECHALLAELAVSADDRVRSCAIDGLAYEEAQFDLELLRRIFAAPRNEMDIRCAIWVAKMQSGNAPLRELSALVGPFARHESLIVRLYVVDFATTCVMAAGRLREGLAMIDPLLEDTTALPETDGQTLGEYAREMSDWFLRDESQRK